MNYSIIIETLIVVSALYICAYAISLVYLLSVGRKMVKREFKLRRGLSMFFTISILSFLYSGIRYITVSNSTDLLEYIPAIGLFAFLGVGCARLSIDKYTELQSMLKPLQKAQKKAAESANKEKEKKDEKNEMVEPSNLTQPLASSKK